MADEISKTTIVVLLILTILISVIGTWTVVTSLSAVPAGQQNAPAQDNTVRISLTVEPQPEPAVPITGNAVLSLEVLP